MFVDGEKNDLHNIYEATVFCQAALKRRAQGDWFIKERIDFLGYLLRKGFEKWGY